MCGIAGYFHLEITHDERLPLLKRMCDTIVHRGPDDEGYYSDEYVGLGMRRLSIIDLSTGHQPIVSEDGKKHIILNGEIYNYQQLKPSLAQSGHNFRTASDTEVVLAQYEQDDMDCVHHLNGMFAIAIWDQAKKRLFLARDRMGVKPLYYFWDGKNFLFASEIKALIASDFIPKTVNNQAVWDYLTFRYVPQPETIWQNVHKLLPGHILTISIDEPRPNIIRYWDIPYTDDITRCSDSQWLEEFNDLFLDAVRLRLIADVPVGILLSGGLDSSSVAAAVSEQHNTLLSSFSVAFADSPQSDELPYARLVSKAIGTDHHEIIINQEDVLGFLNDFVYLTDEPLADLASIPLYYVSKLARQRVKVVLSGEGSDEILGGYTFDQVVKEWKQRANYQKIPAIFRRNQHFHNLLNKFKKPLSNFLSIDDTSTDLRLYEVPPNMTNYLTSDEKRKYFHNQMPYQDSMAKIRDEVQRVRSKDLLNQWLYIYCQSWLVEDLLMKADRMSMANSLELRTPFLDYRLVEWAARTPSRIRVGQEKNGQYETKRVLRQFAKKRLPHTIIERTKMGFPVPLYNWLSNQLKPWTLEILNSNETRLLSWMERDAIRQTVERGTAPNSEIHDRHRVWNLLILELWMQRWNP